MNARRLVLTATISVFAATLADAAELARFKSASVLPSEFQPRRAKARGEVLEPQKGESIQAYIVKPFGDGPHPVIIYMPDCSGLSSEVKGDGFNTVRLLLEPHNGGLPDSSRETFWARRLLSWGYAVVLVDSYTPRGMRHTCTDTKGNAARVPDAYGALAYAAQQPWADGQRIGLLGFLTADHWRVPRADDKDIFVLGSHSFKAAVGFIYFAGCGLRAPMSAPTLVFNGDDQPGKADQCAKLTAEQTAGGAPTEERVSSEFYRNFEGGSEMPDKTTFSEWVASKPKRVRAIAAQVDDFLAEHLRP